MRKEIEEGIETQASISIIRDDASADGKRIGKKHPVQVIRVRTGGNIDIITIEDDTVIMWTQTTVDVTRSTLTEKEIGGKSIDLRRQHRQSQMTHLIMINVEVGKYQKRQGK